jgi:hypothetical protein
MKGRNRGRARGVSARVSGVSSSYDCSWISQSGILSGACPACCMLIVGVCIGLSAVCALLVTAAASQLRQRNVAPLEVQVGHS